MTADFLDGLVAAAIVGAAYWFAIRPLHISE